MKKITLFLIMLSFVSLTNLEAQISTFPYTEDFESGDGGWVADNTTNGTWELGTPAGAIINSAASGANAWVTNLTGTYNTNENSWVTSPVFDFSALSAPAIQMSIWYDAEFSWDGAVLQSSIDNGTTWVNVGAVGDQNNWYTDNTISGSPGGQQEGWSGTGTAGTNAWVMASNSLASLAGQANVILRVAFGSDGSIVDEGFGFDDVTIYEVLCPEPSDLTVSVTTATGATITWTDNGTATIANLEVVETGVTPTGTPNHVGVSSPYSITGLTSSTTYDVYIQADCGSDQSVFVGPISFSTECTTFVAPYTEGFENGGVIPLCWSMDGGEDWEFADDPGFDHIGNDGVMDGNTTTNGYFAFVDSSGTQDPSTLTSPLIDVSALTTPALYFYEISHNEGNANSTLEVEVWDGAAWNMMATYNTNTSGWELKVIDLSSLTITGDIQARFIFSETVPGDFYDDIAIDDVTFDEAPTCFNPTSLAADFITASGAELSWTQDGSVAAWNIEIVTAGSTPTGTPTDASVTNPFTATSLMAATDYEYYVQAICGTELSGWAGPFAFTTECTTFTAPYIESFENNGTIPLCWSMDGGEDWFFDDDPTGSHVGDNGTITGSTISNNYYAYADASGNDGIRTLTSPFIDVSALTAPTLTFYEISNNEGNDNSTLEVEVWDGAAWNLMATYNTNTAGWELKTIDLTTLTITGDVQVRFIFSETTTGDFYDDIAIDDVVIDDPASCPNPSDLIAENLSLTSTQISWTENGTATTWNIEYGVAGFTQGSGTLESNVTANPYVLNSLTPDTSYDVYIQAVCGVGDESFWIGPIEFYTGYCESVPSSNDGDGVNYVNLGITTFTSLGDVTYENQTSPTVNVFQGINTNLEIEFGHGFTYDTNVWIDFNDNLVFEDTELVYQGESSGASSPHLLDASFVMPLTAPIGVHRMRIGTADFGQSTPDPCYDGSWGVTLDFTVNIQELLCTLAEADYTVIPDCDNNQFFIDVNITSMGDATSLELSNDFDTSTVQATATGIHQVGPFPFGSTVKVFVTNEQDNNCVISSENFEVLACPPVNDDCSTATPAVVNSSSTCDAVTAGTILAATPSGVPDGSCTGTPNDDVWFTFEALDEIEIISIINVVGGTTNIDHALYEGSCGALTELYCTDDDAAVTPSLVIGNTYYVRVFSGGTSSETSTFDLCIRPAPTNIICENAENFCSVGGALTTPNIIGIPSTGQVACLGSIPNPTWNIIQIGESGPIEIQIEQTDASGNGLDVDFVIWGPFTSVDQACTDIVLADCPTCPNNTSNSSFYPFGNIVDCSYSASSVENLTIDNAVSGEIYMLLVTNFNGGAGDITITQTNSGATDNGTIEADIEAEITSIEVPIDQTNDPSDPDEVSVCGFDSVTITTDSPFADEYIWYRDGFVITGETSSSLTVTESDNYQVQAFDNQCGSDAFSQIVTINLYQESPTVAPQNITVCDGPEANGIEEFDLDALTTDLALGDDFTVTYYTNTSDANQAINAVSTPYSSSGETLIIRIEDADAATNGYLGCRQLSQVELEVNATPMINQPNDFIVCDDLDGTVDGETSFDLTSINSEVSTDTNHDITYHTSQADADSDTGALSSPYISAGQTIYVRAEDITTGCYSTTSFNLGVNIVPLASFEDSDNYFVCPNATVPITIGITPDNFTAADVTVTWSLDGNSISGSGLTLDTVLEEGDYTATIEFNDTGCTNTITIYVEELDSCIFPQGISPGVSPGQNDTFDLSSFNVTKLEIFNRNGTLVYSKNNYVDEWHGQTNDGKELPVGTYFYTVIYEGGAKSKSAWVYINR
ncbi:fibronectin type III domain-containing protein [Winogradskyella endarachnes]|uniref:T9SS type B sorting domain-containing protein n=1 Tax=Winogradskyella endarachnes TaxID=2681965 RepID=A0A6L6UG96_9FLAO|nr:fibronectin type III domain-containing protein [Winogradskyella endarachnes]MUU79817.1 hypothetical protein [Winogradskyella endarachnes]